MTVRGVIIVQAGHELNLFAETLFQGKHGMDCDISQIQVFVAVFPAGGGTEGLCGRGCPFEEPHRSCCRLARGLLSFA